MSNKPSHSASRSSRVQQASQSGQGRSLVLWIALAAVVVVAAVVAIGVSRSSSSTAGGADSPSGGTVVPSGQLDNGTVQVQGTPLPSARGSGSDMALGATLPTVTGEQFDGGAIVIQPTGKPQVIMGVAHWCLHCQAEVPRIQRWLDDNGMPSDVGLVTVATSNDATRPNYPASNWLRKEKWSVPTMVDDKQNAAAAALGISGFPGFIAVGADGKVVYRTSGEITTEQFTGLIEAARTGQPVT